ncbi:S1 family peptidase [Moritella viscosa]|uniref:S1 family peptidase n=1 Tax=Moritella viscosa TaxID=80854 RepID=UPI00091EAE09|nr:serine protease [Moritella viscosa]SGY81382.1 Putative uncharacterized protein [Moritella viscosa]
MDFFQKKTIIIGILIASSISFYSNAKIDNRIINGYETNSSFEFLAYIEKDNNYRCGGTFLDESHIVTAAHCVTEDNTKNTPIDVNRLKVYFGSNSIDKMKNTLGLVRGVDLITIHNEYDNRFGSNYPNDIAIIKLNAPVKSIKKAKLLDNQELRDAFEIDLKNSLTLDKSSFNIANPNMIAIGWGKTENGQVSEHLRQTYLLSISAEVCKLSHPNNVPSSKGYFCSDTFRVGLPTDTCGGDSGSPILWNYKNKTYIVGLVSYGSNKCDASFSVYTKTDDYMNFINSNSDNPTSILESSDDYVTPKFYNEEKSTTSQNTKIVFYNGAWTTVTGTVNYTYNGKRVTQSQNGWFLGYTDFNLPKGTKDVVFILSRGNIEFFVKRYQIEDLEAKGQVGVSAYGNVGHTWAAEDF